MAIHRYSDVADRYGSKVRHMEAQADLRVDCTKAVAGLLIDCTQALVDLLLEDKTASPGW